MQIIKFSTDSCGPCKQYAPIFERVSTQYPDIEFKSINCQDNPDFTQNYGVKQVPTTLFLDSGGNVKNRNTGMLTESMLKQFIESSL